MCRIRCVLLLAGLLCCGAAVQAQQNRLLPVDDWAYAHIQRLQRRGFLLALHPTALPYSYGEVAAALRTVDRSALNDAERRWITLLKRAVGMDQKRDAPSAGAVLDAGLTATDSRRLDVMRPLDDKGFLYPTAMLRLYWDGGPVVAHMGIRHDLYYDEDPDGLDAAKRLIMRNENAYIGYRGRWAAAYLGRFGNHWGPRGQTAVLISDNPHPYDQLNLRIGGKRFALRSILGELDSMEPEGVYTGRAGDRSAGPDAGSIRRYVAAHRFDWRPSKYFNLSLMEAILFSGENTGFSLKYLNPVNLAILTTDNTPKNDENNGLIAGALWAHANRWTLQGQLLVDDFDFINGKEPASIAVTGSLVYAAGYAHFGLHGTLVSARAYNAAQIEGQYLYLLRGLATQFSDYIEAAGFVDLYLDRWVPGLSLSPQIQWLAQGEGAVINRPYPEDEEAFVLQGNAVRTWRVGARMRYQPSPYWWLRADAGLNRIQNEGFIEGNDTSRPAAQVALGVQIPYRR